MLTELPESLRTLAGGESRPINEAEVLARLRAAWATDIVLYDGEGFRGVTVWFDDFPISIDNIWGDSDSPVADALDEAVAVAQKRDLFKRLHSALMDMDQILHATHVLIEAHPETGTGNVDLDAMD